MTRSAARRHAIGVAIVLAFVLVPVAIRAIAGEGELGLGEAAFFVAVVVAVPLALVFGFRVGERRRLGSFATVALAYGMSAATGVVVALVWQVLGELGWSNTFNRGTTWLGQAANGAYLGVVMVGVWGLFMLLPQAVREGRERERERAELRRDAERARVRSALEPHFVLNTLNAISGLVGEDPEMARELLGDLGDLLRDVVRLSEQEVQPAASEVAWLQRYARILEARHPGKLTFEWALAPDAASLGVPVLLLQPLLENAIYHGALRRPEGGRVRIELVRDAGALRCTIEDDGPGMASEPTPAAKHERPHGLDLTRRRLACDAPGSTLVVDSAPTGTRAIVQLAAS